MVSNWLGFDLKRITDFKKYEPEIIKGGLFDDHIDT